MSHYVCFSTKAEKIRLKEIRKGSAKYLYASRQLSDKYRILNVFDEPLVVFFVNIFK